MLDMITMPKPTRLDLLIIHKLYVLHGVRCCRKHLVSPSRFHFEEVINMGNRCRSSYHKARRCRYRSIHS